MEVKSLNQTLVKFTTEDIMLMATEGVQKMGLMGKGDRMAQDQTMAHDLSCYFVIDHGEKR